MTEDVFARAATGRRAIAELAAGFDESQLGAPSLCAGWAVRDVLGHLVMSLELSFPRFLLAVARDLGRIGRTSERLGREYGARPIDQLIAALREHADDHVAPPGIGPMGPMADACIHLRDMAIPLGLPDTAPIEDWLLVVEFLTTSRARSAGFLPKGRLDGLRFVATDGDWTSGVGGSVVEGPAESLALAITGRRVGLDQLSGPGVEVLGSRL